MKVTKEDLVKMGCCLDHISIFKEVWPDGAEVTEENLRKAFDAGLNVDWWASRKLGSRFLDTKDELLDAFRNACRVHRATYSAGRESLLAAHSAEEEALWKTYQEARFKLWGLYGDSLIQAIVRIANEQGGSK